MGDDDDRAARRCFREVVKERPLGVSIETAGRLVASAISRLRQGFLQNFSRPEAYAFASTAVCWPTARGHRFTDDDRVCGAVIEALMCNFRVDLKLFGPTQTFEPEVARLQPLIRDGLVDERDGIVAMTQIGRPFVRVVATRFDSYRTAPAQAFSIAV